MCKTFLNHQDWLRKGRAEREEIDTFGPKRNACPRCNKNFKREKDLRHHISGCRESECLVEGCGKVFSNRIALRKHMKTHEKSYECGVCGKSYGTAQILKLHKKSHNKLFECHGGKFFGTKFNYERHLKNVHKV